MTTDNEVNEIITNLNNTEIEKALLACVLTSPSAALKAGAMLKADDFYDTRHALIFGALHDLDGEPDELLVASRLRAVGAMGVVGEGYIDELITSPAIINPQRTGQYATQIAELSERRRMISACGDVAKMIYDQSEQLTTIYGKVLSSFTEQARLKREEDMGDVALAALSEFQKRIDNEGALIGLPSGVVDLDNITQGFQGSQLITIAGRPGTGKSVLLAQAALRAAMAGKYVRLYTLEMKGREVMLRLAKNHTLVGCRQGGEHLLSQENQGKIKHALGWLADQPLKIREVDSISQIVAECEIASRKGELDMVVLDYLQIARIDVDGASRNSTRDVQLSTATRTLKNLAQRLDIPVLMGSQLNRDADTGKPALSNLRESGGIEADSNVVVGLWYADPDMYPNTLTASVLKNREGEVGDAKMYFNKPAHRMGDLQKEKIEL